MTLQTVHDASNGRALYASENAKSGSNMMRVAQAERYAVIAVKRRVLMAMSRVWIA